MKYNHVVKYNGVFYQPGQEVPVPGEKVDTSVEDKQSNKRGRPSKNKE